MRSLKPSPTLSIAALLLSAARLAGLGSLSSSFSSFHDAVFLNNHFYLSGFELGKHRLDIEVNRTDRHNRIVDQLIHDTGYNLKLNCNPLPFLTLNLISTSGFNRFQSAGYGGRYENSRLAGEIVLYKSGFSLRNSFGGRRFRSDDHPWSGFENEHELKSRLQNLLVVGGFTRSTLAPFSRLRGYFSVEPAQELRWDRLGLTFLVNGEKNGESYPLAQIREKKNLSMVQGTVKLRYPLLHFGSFNCEGATGTSDARYRLITSNDIASQHRRLNAKITLTPTANTELELNVQRAWTSEVKFGGFANENRDKKMFNALIIYSPPRGHLSFKRNLSLESIVTPNPLNKNDRDIRSDRMNLDLRFQVLANLSTRLTGAWIDEDLIYVERFLTGNTRHNRSRGLGGECDLGLRSFRLFADISGKADYLFFQFNPRRNSYSTVAAVNLAAHYESNPTLVPRLTAGVSAERYYGCEAGRYEPELAVVKRTVGITLSYLPVRTFSIVPAFTLSANENYNPLTHARLPWSVKSGGVSFDWKIGPASEVTCDIKNVRRSYAEPENWLVTLSVTYRFY